MNLRGAEARSLRETGGHTMPKKSKQPRKPKKTVKLEVPKGPCDPEPPKRPPAPTPTRPWDERGGPDPLKWLKLGK